MRCLVLGLAALVYCIALIEFKGHCAIAPGSKTTNSTLIIISIAGDGKNELELTHRRFRITGLDLIKKHLEGEMPSFNQRDLIVIQAVSNPILHSQCVKLNTVFRRVADSGAQLVTVVKPKDELAKLEHALVFFCKGDYNAPRNKDEIEYFAQGESLGKGNSGLMAALAAANDRAYRSLMVAGSRYSSASGYGLHELPPEAFVSELAAIAKRRGAIFLKLENELLMK